MNGESSADIHYQLYLSIIYYIQLKVSVYVKRHHIVHGNGFRSEVDQRS